MKKSIGAKAMIVPTPVWVVGTYGRDDKPNVMTAAWGGICCSKPPCVAIAVQKIRYTYNNLVERNAFTIYVPSVLHAKEADYFGIASGKTTDKFTVTGLTPTKSNCVDAPYVEEFPLALECKLIHSLELGLHTLFIGEVLDVKADEDVLGEKGLPDMNKFKPFTYNPEIRTYYAVGEYLGKAFSIGKEITKG